MASVVTSMRRRVDPAPVTAVVALGDLACIALWVVVGAKYGHSIDPVARPVRVASTFGTFAVGWALASLVGGLYTAEARSSARRAVARTVPAWVVAAAVAQLLRATAVFPGDAAPAFFLVSVGVGLAVLLPWRVGVTRLAGGADDGSAGT